MANKKLTNAIILNSIRQQATQTYKERIPEATEENGSEIISKLEAYDSQMTEFIDAILDKVGKTKIINKVWGNKLAPLHKGMLPYGKSIEMIYTEMAQAKNFNENFGGTGATYVDDLLKQEKPNSKVQYISTEHQLKYKTTITFEQLRSAFLSETGINDLINSIVSSLVRGANMDEYLLMKGVIDSADIKKVTLKADTAVELSKTVRTLVEKLQFPSAEYNKAGVKNFADQEDLVIFITPETKADVDVTLLATAFNMDKADLISRVIIVDEFADVKTKCVIASKDFVQFYDRVYTFKKQENGAGLYENRFLHKWSVVGQCDFEPAVKIVIA